MATSEKVLTEREIGEVGISIGTSLAIEGAFGQHPDREVDPAPIHKFNALWVNVSTLFRNVFGSLTADEQARVLPEDLLNVMANEISILQAKVHEFTGGRVRVVFYVNDLRGILEKKYPHASIKKPSTPKQRTFENIHDTTLEHLGNYLDDNTDYRIFKHDIQGEGDVLLLTHQPIDLLSQYRFDSLTLLESHTGKVKPKSQWGSKLGAKDESLPFNAFTLQVFGDGSTNFMALPIKYRRPIINLAKQERWTPVTTADRIKMSLGTITDLEVRERLKKVISSN